MNLKKRISPIITSILLLFAIDILCHIFLSYTPKYAMSALDNGWEIDINGNLYEDKSINEFYKLLTKPLERGDRVTFRTTLPDLGFLPFPAIQLRSRYTTLECYVGDFLVYEYAPDMYEKGAFIGKSYQLITLPRDYAKKILTIKMVVSEYNAATNYKAPILGNSDDLKTGFIHDNIVVIATGVFMTIFGVIYLFLSLLFFSVIPNSKAQVFESFLCMNLGAWLLSYYNLFSLFYNTKLETQIEYFTLYLIVPYFYLILLSIQPISKKRAFYTITFISCLIPAIQYMLHYVFNIHMRRTVFVYHIDAFVCFCIILYFLYNNIKNHNIEKSDMIQMNGISAFAIALFIHFISYILDMAHLDSFYRINKTIMCFGYLILAVSMLANYFIFITRSYAQKQEHASLSHLAYADGLTNLPNRAKADKELSELKNETNDYCIVSIDLNGLKTVNDKFGHPTGDKYIKDFAKVLSTTFGENDFCGRIGGDEFIAIIKNASNKDIPSMIDRMNSALNVMNVIYSEYHRSVASGFAFLHEFSDNDPHEVYLLADQRMYENKKIMHEQLGIHLRL
ncbi:MAG: GGDEF domain-containing protein [Butyrivibrio sp.]|uniref:GGDEF domain-containing protein n=1 Tax=Butyrivibrio sp. TaxID=28121 RepID=UPI001B0CEBF3|nr:GGDEF domain-containing protein [Butyrivibrio sp.]MBO6240041.1 GGDEF domain-containing protein [Butyrivibrio sp.]